MKARTLILTAGAALALAAPAAQGMPLQADGAASGSAASHYSARALQAMGLRGQATARSYSAPLQAVRPDDRAGIRDPNGLAVLNDGKVWGTIDAPSAVANEPGVGPSAPVSTPQVAVRPDNRPGTLGIGETPVDVVAGSPSGGFDWGNAGIGLGAASGFALLLLGGSLLFTGRRHSTPAAG